MYLYPVSSIMITSDKTTAQYHDWDVDMGLASLLTQALLPPRLICCFLQEDAFNPTLNLSSICPLLVVFKAILWCLRLL